MDLDDLIEDLLPKKTKKKLKKKLKKKSLLGLLLELVKTVLAAFTGGKSQPQSRQPQSPTSQKANPSRVGRGDVPLADTWQQAIDQASTYHHEIEALRQAADPDSMQRLRLNPIADRVNDWVTAVSNLVARIRLLENNPLLHQDRKQVPKAVSRLEKQLGEVKDTAVRAKLEHTLAQRRRQLDQLRALEQNLQLAELKIEGTLAQLGTVYSQILSGQFTREIGDYRHLMAEVDEEVLALQDYLEALDEVQQTRTAMVND